MYRMLVYVPAINTTIKCPFITLSVVISGDGWFYDFGDSNRAFKRDCTVYTGY